MNDQMSTMLRQMGFVPHIGIRLIKQGRIPCPVHELISYPYPDDDGTVKVKARIQPRNPNSMADLVLMGAGEWRSQYELVNLYQGPMKIKRNKCVT